MLRTFGWCWRRRMVEISQIILDSMAASVRVLSITLTATSLSLVASLVRSRPT
uniref:Non-specific serine/threonine protein kinase n=1 Tax=Rhizophora mucronata TaxID=61149 RepID=A0A2P2QRA3_RHIMU